jgi:two-component system LytT family sensor kinase
VNNLDLPSNDIRWDERPPSAHERLPGEADAVAAELGESGRARTDSSWRPTIIVVMAFWIFWFLAQTTYNLIDAPGDAVKYALGRTLVAGSGVAVSLAIAAALRRLRSAQLSVRALAAIALTLVATIIHGAITREIWMIFAPDQRSTSPLWVVVATDFLMRFWFFATQSAIILAQSYASDIRERDERIHALQALAHSAQLRALRNQLNPHFLFNALNSIAALISGKRPKEAETMTENLADFLRLTLSLDPQKLITLGDELRLQQLYLDIEKARFPDRLRVTVDVPESLRNALVPSLITQPLVENSIKYAVARSTEPVELRIAARTVGDSVELVIADSGGDARTAPHKGARLGLRNVGERIQMHYGDQGRFQAEAGAAGGYRNLIVVPLRLRQ